MASKRTFGFLAATACVPWVAHCQVYLTEDQALKAIFPSETFARQIVALSPDEIRLIEEKSGEKVRNQTIIAWVSPKKSVVFVDQALGKHEFITYAVGISGAGSTKTVQGLEILEYRETYGYQVRGEAWRKQFVGKDSHSPLKLNKDIVNISGATLSSAHVTSGVRRVLQTYEAVRARL